MGTNEQREELTEYERAWLTGTSRGIKAVRIIDAHAADRAALVAQLVVAERSHREALNIEAEVSRWKDLAHEANAARVALDGRVRELVAQLEARAAADTTLITFNDSLKAAEARVQELESTNAALRNELSRDMQASAESECAALRAEVERLRNHIVCINDERSAAEGGEHLQRAAAEVAESRLAAANALLGRFKARYNALPAIPHAGQWKACAVDTMADIEGWPKDDDARLAAVPATAPTRDEGEAE